MRPNSPALLRSTLPLLISLAATYLPTAHAQQPQLIYEFDYGFFPGTVNAPPSLTELNNLVCATNEYTQALFRESSGNDQLIVEATNIDFTFDAEQIDVEEGTPLIVTMAIEVSAPDGSEIPEATSTALYSFDTLELIENYLHKSESTIWTNVGYVSKYYSTGIPEPGQLERGVCDGTFTEAATEVSRPPRPETTTTEAPTLAPTFNPIRAILLALAFEFLEGSSRIPELEEVDELLCMTDYFFTIWLQRATRDLSVTSWSTKVQNQLNEDGSLWLMIVLNVTSADGNDVDLDAVAETINEATTANRLDFIQNYCWKTQEENLFRSVTSVEYLAQIVNDEAMMNLDPTCGTTGFTRRPTPSPQSAKGETYAPSPIPQVEGDTTEAYPAVVFTLEYAMTEGLRSPTDEETDNLLCRTDQFFADVMKEKTGAEIETYGSLLEVNYDESASTYPITIVFASNSTYATSGNPVDPQVVTDAMNVTTDDILVYISMYVLDTLEDDVFINTLAVSFNVELRDEMNELEAPWPRTCRSRDRNDSTIIPSTGDPTSTDTANPATSTETPTAGESAGLTPSPTIMGTTSPPTATSQPFDGTTSPTLGTTSPTLGTTNPPSVSSSDPSTSTIRPTVQTAEPPSGVATDSPTAKATEMPVDNGGGAMTESPTARGTEQSSNGGGFLTNRPTAKATEPPFNPGVTGPPTARPATSVPTTISTPTSMPSNSPSDWARYTNAPVAPTVTPPPSGQHLSTGIFPVRTTFLISNLAGLTDENTIRFSSGLDIAWSTFATEMVSNVTRDWIASGQASSQRRQVSEMEQHDHRSLTINRVPNSAKVTSIKPVTCGPTDSLEATCLNTEAEYMYSIEKEYFLVLNQTFYNETNKALTNGTFQFILDRASPGTPLVIGRIGRDAFREYSNSGGDGGGGGGMSGGAKFCIVMLVFALIGVPLYILYRRRKEEADKSPAYEDEGFAYDFLIPSNAKIQTEVDDYERHRKSLVGVAVPEGFSTTSSEEGPAGESQSTAERGGHVNEVEEDDGDIDVQAPRWWGHESANLGNDAIFDNERDSKSRKATGPEGVGDDVQVVLNSSDKIFENEGVSTSNATWGADSKDSNRRAAPSAGHMSGPYGVSDSKLGRSMREPYSHQDSKFGMSMREPYGDHDSKFGMSMREPYGEQEDKFGMSFREPYGEQEDKFGMSFREPYGEQEDKFGMSFREPYGEQEDKFGMSMREPYGEQEDKFGMSFREPYSAQDSKFGTSMRAPFASAVHDQMSRNEERDSATSRTASIEAPFGSHGYQAGGQEPKERDQTWEGYDDHLRDLVNISAMGRGEEESISFSHDDGDDEEFADESPLLSFEHGARPYQENSVSELFGGALDSNHSNPSLGMESMESEGGWEDESGHSSHTSSHHSDDMWT